MTAIRKSDSGEVRLTASDLAPRRLGGGRVLVVEEGADAAATLTAMLRLNGFDARSAHSGAEALKAIAAHQPRAVLMDLDLPDADACEIIRRVRAKADPPAVVVLTAHTDGAHRRAAADAGATEYLLKPVEPSVLVRLLLDLCPASD